ncbi:hypothetical protein K458DRAFT_394237 [Lentithecium fluviatile CBS 122367]|uniref:Uncharacterized protein n=1 Tax=Lentithecium fluviatile CBS 122367 TaxID=1168545 RepID=A0A6G1IM76_9PLEO|nr:hypothetical protein K458DRAFT_394237 [Lentithecium fluviatile CBS 122367]
MGSSIYIEGERMAGTMGGFVALKGGKEENETMYGLTNWNIVRDSRLDGTARPNIESPGSLDHEEHFEILQWLVEPWAPGKFPKDPRADDFRIEFEEKLAYFEEHDRGISHVFAGSRCRTFFQEKFNTNDRTGRQPENVPPDTPIKHLLSAKIPGRLEARKWTTFSLVENAINITKYGRSSKRTFGVLNAAPVVLNWERLRAGGMMDRFDSTDKRTVHIFGADWRRGYRGFHGSSNM